MAAKTNKSNAPASADPWSLDNWQKAGPEQKDSTGKKIKVGFLQALGLTNLKLDFGGNEVPGIAQAYANAHPDQNKNKNKNKNNNKNDNQSVKSTGGNPISRDAVANKTLGQQLAAPYGWSTGNEWTALNNLVMAESGWDNTAQNPSSTAYGIGQFLDSTWATVGGTKTSNASTQIKLMLKYIKVRYGDPIKAWDHEMANHWY